MKFYVIDTLGEYQWHGSITIVIQYLSDDFHLNRVEI